MESKARSKSKPKSEPQAQKQTDTKLTVESVDINLQVQQART